MSLATGKHLRWFGILDVPGYGLHLPEPSTEDPFPHTDVAPEHNETGENLSQYSRSYCASY